MGDREIVIDRARLRPRQGRLEGPTSGVHLEPRVVQVAAALAARPGDVVSRDELIEAVWGGYPGADRALTTCISKLRSALSEVGASPEVVETVPKSGYRIDAAAVGRVDPGADGDRPCIAVLPLRTIGLNPDEAYLGEALAEELHLGLSRTDAVRVAARTSTFALAERGRPLPDFATSLGADLVVEGSVRKHDGRIAVRIALCSAPDSTEIGSREVEAPESRMDRLSKLMLEALGEALEHSQGIALAAGDDASPSVPPEAYRAFLKGRYAWYRENSDPGRALALFEAAIDVVPDYASPHAGLVDCYCTYGAWQMMPQAQARRLALQHADRAIRLAPSNPDVRFSYGYALMYARWDWPGAEVAFREVLIRYPDHVLARSFLGLLLTVQGRDREAIEIGEDLVASDPVSAWCWWMRALYAFYRRDFGSVAEWAQEALDLAPHDPLNFWLASAGYAMTGDHARALDLADRLDEAAGEFDMFFGFATITRVLCGQRDQALVRLRELQRRAEHRPVSQVVMAFVHSALGDTEPALDALEAAFEERNMVGWFIAREFTLDPLRAEPRFQRLLEAMQLPVDGPAHRDGIPVQALPRDPS